MGGDGQEGRKEAQMRSRSSHVFPLTDRASSIRSEEEEGELEQANATRPSFSAVELPAFRFFVRPSL